MSGELQDSRCYSWTRLLRCSVFDSIICRTFLSGFITSRRPGKLRQLSPFQFHSHLVSCVCKCWPCWKTTTLHTKPLISERKSLWFSTQVRVFVWFSTQVRVFGVVTVVTLRQDEIVKTWLHHQQVSRCRNNETRFLGKLAGIRGHMTQGRVSNRRQCEVCLCLDPGCWELFPARLLLIVDTRQIMLWSIHFNDGLALFLLRKVLVSAEFTL